MSYVTYEGPDEISKALLSKLNETVGKYSGIQTQIAAADGDRDTAIQSWMDSTDDAQAQKIRDRINTAMAQLRALAEKNVRTVELSEDDRAKLDVELTELKGKIQTGYKVLDNLIQNMSEDPEGVKKSLETIDNPVKSNRGRKAGQTGSSLPRISAMVTISGGNFDDKDAVNEFDSFSKVAAVLNCEVVDLQKAFADAAGVKHEDIKTVTKGIEFTFQPNENGTTYTLKTEPKTRKPRGSSTAAETPESGDSSSTEENKSETPAA